MLTNNKQSHKNDASLLEVIKGMIRTYLQMDVFTIHNCVGCYK